MMWKKSKAHYVYVCIKCGTRTGISLQKNYYCLSQCLARVFNIWVLTTQWTVSPITTVTVNRVSKYSILCLPYISYSLRVSVGLQTWVNMFRVSFTVIELL
jgi:DNA-directed RNA polymerase subunit RPC12/RpoP